MVATSFAADTPLAVTALVARHGIAGNWFWWSFALGGMVTVFVYARFWRRAGVMTDVELVELRYGGKPAAFLRGFRSIYIAFLVNSIIVGWVTAAMLNVLKFTVFSGTEAATGASDWLIRVARSESRSLRHDAMRCTVEPPSPGSEPGYQDAHH